MLWNQHVNMPRVTEMDYTGKEKVLNNIDFIELMLKVWWKKSYESKRGEETKSVALMPVQCSDDTSKTRNTKTT